DAAAHRPAAHVELFALPAESLDECFHVLGPVVETARGIDGLRLRAAEAAEVGSRDAELFGQLGRNVLPEASGHQVAVNEQDGCAVLAPAGPDAGANAIRVDVCALHETTLESLHCKAPCITLS